MNSKRDKLGCPNGLPSLCLHLLHLSSTLLSELLLFLFFGLWVRCHQFVHRFVHRFVIGFKDAIRQDSSRMSRRFKKRLGKSRVDWVPISEFSLSSCKTGDMLLLELKPNQQKNEARDFGKKAWKLESWKWRYFQSASVPACVPCQPPPWHDGLSQQLWFPEQPHFGVWKAKRQLQSLSKPVILDLFCDETAKTILIIFHH